MSRIRLYNSNEMVQARWLSSCTFLQLFLELFDLLLKLAQECVFGVFIYSRFILDVLRTVSVAQGADGLVVVVVCWSDVCTLKKKQQLNLT